MPLVIGQFLEMVDNNTGIVGSTTGSNYYVRILSTLNRCANGRGWGFNTGTPRWPGLSTWLPGAHPVHPSTGAHVCTVSSLGALWE